MTFAPYKTRTLRFGNHSDVMWTYTMLQQVLSDTSRNLYAVGYDSTGINHWPIDSYRVEERYGKTLLYTRSRGSYCYGHELVTRKVVFYERH